MNTSAINQSAMNQSAILRHALTEQYHAALAMLADCIVKCPDDQWLSGTPARPFWRIAFHTVYFTHLYLGQNEDAYQPWPGRPDGNPELWRKPWHRPDDLAPYSKAQMLDYLAYVDTLIDPTIEALDLEAQDTGISWYKNMSKLSHELLTLRHLQGHVGQLSERLMAQDIDTDWISKAQGIHQAHES